MSGLERTASFHHVRSQKAGTKSIDEHEFIFNVYDMNNMLKKNCDDISVLAEMGGVQGLAWALRTNLKTGLPIDEQASGFAKRQAKYGVNEHEKPPEKSWLLHCWEAFQDVMLYILCVTAVVAIVLGVIEDPGHGWAEGLAILVAVLIVTIVGGTNNWSQDKQFRALDASKKKPQCTVIRQGADGGHCEQVINAAELMVGDVVKLGAGAAIPADGVIIASQTGIEVDESAMTGESVTLKRNAYDDPFVLSGTSVAKGECTVLVTGVGRYSEIGRVLSSVSEAPRETPLQEKLTRVAALIGKLGGAVAVMLFFVLFIRWAIETKFTEFNEAEDEGWNQLLEFFIIAVTIVVVAVPEGLPLAVTISLAYSMKKMYADNNFVRVLSACETMGNATTICSDKTGTLTQNQMTVVNVWLAGKLYKKDIPREKDISPKVDKLLVDGVVLNSRPFPIAEVAGQPPEKWEWNTNQGNQTDVSLVAWMCKYPWIKVEAERAKPENEVELSFPFDSKVKCSSIVLQRNGQFRRYFKGASERMLQMSDRTVDEHGNIVPLNHEKVQAEIDAMAERGLRTIGFCYVDFPHIERNDVGELQEPPARNDCVFFCITGIQDPLRPEAYDSVRTCQRAGIVVRMVTGDHLATAKFIARDCGILTGPNHIAMEGPDLRKLFENNEDAKLQKIIPNLRVLARSEPLDKQRLVEWLMANDQVVAVTGDGTNDAPALKKAHVGIAMGIAGTDVAKNASDIIILDDRFDSIVKAAMWGRSVYDNIRKFVQFQLTVNVVALSISLIGAFAKFNNPLTAVQLLWVNLIMDTLAALALGTEWPTASLLDRKPYRPNASLISPIMWRNILGQSAFQLAMLLVLLFGYEMFQDVGDGFEKEDTVHRTIIFNTFVWMQIFNEINSRKVNGEMNVFDKIFQNWLFSAIMVLIIFMQFLMVTFVGSFADTTALDIESWLLSIVLGAISLPVGFLIRLIKVNEDAGRVEIDDDVVFCEAHLDNPDYDDRHYAMNARENKRNGKANGEVAVNMDI